MRNYHQTSGMALWILIQFVSAPRNDSKCRESIPSFIMHECTACNQTKLCCSLARENEIMMMFLKMNALRDFYLVQVSWVNLPSTSRLWLSCKIVKSYTQFTSDIYDLWQEEKREHKGKNASKMSLCCLGIWLMCLFFFCKVSTGSVSACDTLKRLSENQKTNRSLSNVISFFSLMWTVLNINTICLVFCLR